MRMVGSMYRGLESRADRDAKTSSMRHWVAFSQLQRGNSLPVQLAGLRRASRVLSPRCRGVEKEHGRAGFGVIGMCVQFQPAAFFVQGAVTLRAQLTRPCCATRRLGGGSHGVALLHVGTDESGMEKQPGRLTRQERRNGTGWFASQEPLACREEGEGY